MKYEHILDDAENDPALFPDFIGPRDARSESEMWRDWRAELREERKAHDRVWLRLLCREI